MAALYSTSAGRDALLGAGAGPPMANYGRLTWPGLWLAVEGVDGSGKTTLASCLAERYTHQGRRVRLVRHPGGTQAGALLREAIIRHASDGVYGLTSAFIAAADWRLSYYEMIQPALEDGDVVISDRTVASTVPYSAAGWAHHVPADPAWRHWKRLGEFIATAVVFWPQVTFWLDVDAAEGRARTSGRGRELDSIERMPFSFHADVQAAYEWLAFHAENWVRLDASEPAGRVLAAALSALGEGPGPPGGVVGLAQTQAA